MNRRQGELLRYIEEHGNATFSELSKVAPQCSNMTIWRDLKQLQESERIIRTRGGAMHIATAGQENGGSVTAGSYEDRASRNTELKKRIGRAASVYVKPGMSLFFDSGSTIMALVDELSNQRYSIVTYGANIAIALSRRCGGNIYVIGGEINRDTLSCTGKVVETMLDEINIDTAFMTSSGFSNGCGFTTSNMAEQAVKKRVVAKAPRVIMLLDSSKFGKIFPFSFAQLDDIDVLITDMLLPERFVNDLKDSGKEVIIT